MIARNAVQVGLWGGLAFGLAACAHRVPPETASSAQAIQGVLAAQQGAMGGCYQLAKSGTQGRMLVEFSIAPTGEVKGLKLKETTLKQPTVETCVMKHLGKMKFAPPVEGQTVQVRYPILFR